MEDKIYFKTRYDGIWESSPHKAFAINVIIYLIIFFSSIFIMSFLSLPGIIIAVWLISISVLLIVRALLSNNSKNMSKSTAFIERDGVLYAIQLLYTNRDLGTETDRRIIYMPSGSIEQAVTLNNNKKVAADVQAHEKEIRERRSNVSAFSIGLDDILQHIQKHPKQYKALCDDDKSKLDFLLMYNIENAGMTSIKTSNANYNFLILNNPKIVEETDKYFKISFMNEANQICTSKFTNCYEHLVENIKSGNYNN